MREGLPKYLKIKLNAITRGWTQQKLPDPPKILIYFLPYYRLWPCGSANCAHAAEGEWATPHIESQKAWFERKKWGTYQREVQVCITRERPTSHIDLPLTHMVCTQSTGVQNEAKYKNIAYPTGASQVQILVRSQLDYQLYQYQRSIEKCWLAH